MSDTELAALLIAWIDDVRAIEDGWGARLEPWIEAKARKTANHMAEILARVDPEHKIVRYGGAM